MALVEELAEKCRVVPVEADLATAQGLDRVTGAIREHGPLRYLVNNAGYSPYSLFAGCDLPSQMGMIPLHCEASVALCHAALPAMLDKGCGTIINVSSLASFVTGRTLTVYSGTKAFINAFSQSLHAEVGDRGIEVQVFCPGFVHTGMHAPMEAEGFDKKAFPEEFWMTATEAVSCSMKALGTGRRFVIPGEQNRAFARSAVQATLAALQEDEPVNCSATMEEMR